MDLYLKFTSSEEAKPLLYTVKTEYQDENGIVVPPVAGVDGVQTQPEGTTPIEVLVPKFLNLDIIGDIYKPTGKMIETEGPDGHTFEIPEMEKLDGYHVNIRPVGEDTSALEAYMVVPANPVRIWG